MRVSCLAVMRLEQLVVERDVVVVFGQLGRNLFGKSLEFVVGIGLGEAAENEIDTGKQQTAEFERFDGVLEGWSLGIVDNGFDFGIVLFDGLLEGGHIVFGLDLLEGRYAERGVKLAEQRVLLLLMA